MPKPRRRQATWAPRVSIPPSIALPQPPTAQIGRAWRCFSRACRSVAQALEHEGNGDAAGTEGVGNPQERAMPKPRRRQATNVGAPSEHPPIDCSPTASHGSNRPCAWRCLLEACRSVAQALEHEDNSTATGRRSSRAPRSVPCRPTASPSSPLARKMHATLFLSGKGSEPLHTRSQCRQG